MLFDGMACFAASRLSGKSEQVYCSVPTPCLASSCSVACGNCFFDC